MISLLQSTLEMLPPLSLAATPGSPDTILPSLAELLFLALSDCQKNQAFFCRMGRFDLIGDFLARTKDKSICWHLLQVVYLVAKRSECRLNS